MHRQMEIGNFRQRGLQTDLLESGETTEAKERQTESELKGSEK